ncbi:MAG: 4Fe-4S binding protein [Verrucomicrobia bacterium]|nr:4Fe-4S binding protein [Verrucomicrobiota bacterium]
MGDRVKTGRLRVPWKWLRRAAQLAFLFGFLWLFRKTESDGTGVIQFAANLLFRLDPLVAASAILAGKQFIALVWPALITIALTLVLGRFFCGWVCPLGTLLDMTRHLLPQRFQRSVRASALPLSHSPTPPSSASHFLHWRVAKFFLLGVVLVSAVFGLQLIGYVNPFSILVRGMAVAVDPWLNRGVTAPFTWLYKNAPESVTNVTEPVYEFLKAGVLPFQQNAFVWAGVSFAILLAVFALEGVERRFWCRNLCPSGALMGLMARFALLRRLPVRVCGNCKAAADCDEFCRMGAFDERERLIPESCNLCLDCVTDCPSGVARFGFRKTKAAPAPLEPSRRLFLASLATGVALPVIARAVGDGSRLPADLIRPPGARGEREFLDLCVRCAECMKVCPTNALQPALFETGVEGAFSPRFIAQLGYCEYNCTLCGQVCPTGAIRRLPLPEKQKFIMGKAVFDKDLCLPFAKGESCITCEEHCPLPEKAILFREAEAVVKKTGQCAMMKQPFTVLSLCTGCGICETKCPIEGKRGVRIVREETVPADVKKEYEELEKTNPRPAATQASERAAGY